jgi:hypothetical protein
MKLISDFIAILGRRVNLVSWPKDQMVGPVPSFLRTKVASVGPVLANNFRSRPDPWGPKTQSDWPAAGPNRPAPTLGLPRFKLGLPSHAGWLLIWMA